MGKRRILQNQGFRLKFKNRIKKRRFLEAKIEEKSIKIDVKNAS